jgi:hypothetical protein
LGLFQNSYNRPGPGVNKNQPEKKPFFRFFEIFFRKFWDLIKLNLIFAVPLLIALVLTVLLNTVTNQSFILLLPLVFISPFIAGLAFVTRNFAREEHVFILSDFIVAMKNNWAAFLINGVVCYFAYLIFSVSIPYYAALTKLNNIFLVPFVICTCICILFIFAQYYVPIMMIMFDLKIRQVYKNAMIFSIVGLWRNLLLTVIFGVLFFILFILYQWMPLTFILAALLIFLILFAFCMFLINFTVYPLIYKTMVEPYEKEKLDSNHNADFHDNLK